MLSAWLAQCVSIVTLPVVSLSEPIAANEDEGGEGTRLIGNIADPVADVETEAWLLELAPRVPKFLASLPSELRVVALRHYWHGELDAEIARQLGVHRSTVKRRLAKIVRLGREFFGVTEH